MATANNRVLWIVSVAVVVVAGFTFWWTTRSRHFVDIESVMSSIPVTSDDGKLDLQLMLLQGRKVRVRLALIQISGPASDHVVVYAERKLSPSVSGRFSMDITAKVPAEDAHRASMLRGGGIAGFTGTIEFLGVVDKNKLTLRLKDARIEE